MKRARWFDPPAPKPQVSRTRARVVVALLMLGFTALVAKALHVQGMTREFLQMQGERRYAQTLLLPATRGKIFDRTGTVVLASNAPARAIWAIPEDVQAATPSQLAAVAKLLDVREADLRRRLGDEGKEFVYLKRQVPLDVAERVAALNVPGLHQKVETRRIYPEGDMAAHVVGLTNTDDQGIEGMELAFDQELAGKPGSRRVIRDRLGRVIEDTQAVVPSMNGRDLLLSLDAGMQFDLYTALGKAMQETRARAASGVVLDARTGEVLALVNLPSYDPNQRDARTGQALRNRVVTDMFDPGSVLKPFVVGLALDRGVVNAATWFDTGNGKLTYHGEDIRDVSANGVINVADILRRSSNIGMTLLSERLSPQDMWVKFTELGFGRAPQVSFPGATPGLLRPWERWRPIERATMAYGYGISVSLLQIAQAYTTFARDGDMVSLSFVRREGQPASVPVYSPDVASVVRQMLEAAAGPDGATLAQVQGYRVAGKSGTARKFLNGKYSKTLYRSSFAGFAPVSDPRIVVAITIDEPRGAYFGGRVAAPVFSEVVTASLRRLGVQPDAPVPSLTGALTLAQGAAP